MTLVLLTPIGLDAGCWDWMPLPDGAVAKHTFPGFGDRPRAPSQPTMASLADEVAEAYEGPLDLLGVSLGGMVAQHLAIRHPGRVRSLMTCCAGADADPATMEARAQAAERDGMEGVLEDTLARWFTPAMRALEPQPPAATYARTTLLGLDPRCFADGWRAIAGHDARERLPEVSAPTTALAGTDDTAATLPRVREIAELVPGARLVEMPGAHMIPLEHPRALGAALAEHLAWARGA